MTPPRVIRAGEGRRSPWKNGGGETVEVAVHPAGSGLDDFDWRVSTAIVAADGPFSAFPGIDRTLAILSGDGLELTVGAGEPVRLTAASDPIAFPADAPCAARLLGGPVTDLNVMTRRGRHTHAVGRLAVNGTVTLAGRGGTTLVFCRDGGIAAGGVSLAPGDALVLTDAVDLAPRHGTATALVVTIRP